MKSPDPGAVPQDPAAAPQNPVAAPQYPASAPQYPAAAPQYPAAAPQYPAAAPQYPGAAPPDQAEASARIKRSVSVAIHDPIRPGAVLLVQRPEDDADLPGVWGLPAASLDANESWEDAARRAGAEKLGVALRLGGVRAAGELQRAGYTLVMRLLDATIVEGEPSVAQPAHGVTRYAAWRWGVPADLVPAADAGSLCSRLYLEG